MKLAGGQRIGLPSGLGMRLGIYETTWRCGLETAMVLHPGQVPEWEAAVGEELET